MKTTTLLAVAIFTLSTAFANGNETNKANQVALYEVQDQQFRLIYPFEEKETISIQIKDQNGSVITTDKVKNQTGFRRKYDMSALSDGSYTMIFESKSAEFEKSFNIKTAKQMAVNHLGDKRVKLIYSDEVNNETLRIYNKNMDLIHREEYQKMDGFSKVYDLSAFDCDEFTFQLGEETVALAVNN